MSKRAAEEEAGAPAKVPRVAKDADALLELLRPIREGLPPGVVDQRAALRSVASSLLQEWEMLIAGARHRIVELEAYVHSDQHADPYTHSDPDQTHCGVWYFHKKGGTFKTGSFKGMDLACGGGEKVHAGLLIRSVEDIESKRVIEGPCLVVDHILKLNKSGSITALVAGRGAAALPAASTPELKMVRAAKKITTTVWEGPRVGLFLKEEDPANKAQKAHSAGKPVEFCMRPYRFATDPSRIKKMRSGFAAQAKMAGKETSMADLKIPQKHLNEYVSAVVRGQKEDKPEKFLNDKLSKQADLCELFGACWKYSSGQ